MGRPLRNNGAQSDSFITRVMLTFPSALPTCWKPPTLICLRVLAPRRAWAERQVSRTDVHTGQRVKSVSWKCFKSVLAYCVHESIPFNELVFHWSPFGSRRSSRHLRRVSLSFEHLDFLFFLKLSHILVSLRFKSEPLEDAVGDLSQPLSAVSSCLFAPGQCCA